MQKQEDVIKMTEEELDEKRGAELATEITDKDVIKQLELEKKNEKKFNEEYPLSKSGYY